MIFPEEAVQEYNQQSHVHVDPVFWIFSTLHIWKTVLKFTFISFLFLIPYPPCRTFYTQLFAELWRQSADYCHFVMHRQRNSMREIDFYHKNVEVCNNLLLGWRLYHLASCLWQKRTWLKWRILSRPQRGEKFKFPKFRKLLFKVAKHLPLAWSAESQAERTKLLTILDELLEKTKPKNWFFTSSIYPFLIHYKN